MKIKFVKEYRALQEDVYDIYEVGIIENMPETAAQWLIDNGFAEEVKESGWWKPKYGVDYYYVNDAGVIVSREGFLSMSTIDDKRVDIGNAFRSKAAAERYRDYLKAIATVRQDEGVLTPEESAKNRYNYYIWIHDEFGLEVHGFNADYVSVNTVLFDTKEHAQASLDEHPDEWKIIANYDWSRE